MHFKSNHPLAANPRWSRFNTEGRRLPIWHAGFKSFVTSKFFPFKIQETCTLTTFVEQKPEKLSLCVKKLRNFM